MLAGVQWAEHLVIPAVLLVVGWILQSLRKENTAQHAEGRALVNSVADSVHNLTGKVDAVADLAAEARDAAKEATSVALSTSEGLKGHISDHEEAKKFWKRKDDPQ